MKKIAVIGAGAAGCFCSIELKKRLPDALVCVFEAGQKALAKVAVTGGGRCNITNTFASISNMAEAYPRGSKLMKKALGKFGPKDTLQWFGDLGVEFVEMDRGCIFPKSQDAMQIVSVLLHKMRALGVQLHLGQKIQDIRELLEDYDAVVLCTGGGAVKMLQNLPQVPLEPLCPSLFTLKLSDQSLKDLSGTLVRSAQLRLAGEAFKSADTLLITDWGVSGPATLKLSAYAARHLAQNGYSGTLLINYLGLEEQQARTLVSALIADGGSRLLVNTPPQGITSRLWRHLVLKAGLREDIRLSELGSKGVNKIVNILINDEYTITGRCHFKEEFVTCGGVSLSGVDSATLQSKQVPGLYFAGEVLDIDGITGGYNLQAAWSTAMMVAQAIEKEFKQI